MTTPELNGAGLGDSGRVDSGLVDSGLVDSGLVDSGPGDSGVVDSGPGARLIDGLLGEAGMDDAVELRTMLLELQALGTGTAPAPSAELAALMTASTAAGSPKVTFASAAAPASPSGSVSLASSAGSVSLVSSAGPVSPAGPVRLSTWRLLRHRKLLVAAVAVAATVGVGATAAAASPAFRESTHETITFLIDAILPGAADAPDAPVSPDTSDAPGSRGATAPPVPAATEAPDGSDDASGETEGDASDDDGAIVRLPAVPAHPGPVASPPGKSTSLELPEIPSPEHGDVTEPGSDDSDD